MTDQLPPYISQRLDDQINWYDKKSANNKLRFRACQLIVIITSASIPIINLGIPLTNPVTHLDANQALGITAILGGIITIVTALSQMDAYFETWVLYRTTAEALKRERFLYVNSAADYSDLPEPAKFKLMVERIEAMLSAENSKFLALQQNAKQQSEQQLNNLLLQQREINRQQRQELMELREFQKKYRDFQLIDGVTGGIDTVRTALAEIKFPIQKESIQAYVEQNKSKIKDIDSITLIINKLPSKEYANMKEIEAELMK